MMQRASLAVFRLPAALLLLLAACKDSSAPPVPTTLEISAGDGQTAAAGAQVGVPPAVRVLDGGGNPMAGQQVTFAVASGGGSVTGGAATTDQQGVARVGSWTLGTAAGANALRASTGSLAPIVFTATATAAAPATLARLAGDGQTAPVVTALPVSPSVRVEDAYGNPVVGIRVTFAATSGGGVVIGSAVNTDAAGTASVVSWRLGPAAGPQTLQASVNGAPPVVFTATGTPTDPTTVAVDAGNGQSAPVGSAVPVRPRVRVTDTWGNGLPGHPVTFAVTGGGGTITGAQVTSGADGGAEVGSWILGTTMGVNTLTASSPGLATATFTVTGVPAAPASATVQEGDAQTVPVASETPVRPAVLLRDQYGNPVPGREVVFAVASGGGTVSGARQFTDYTGVARVGGWVVGPAEGANTLTATTAGLTALTFTATGSGQGGGIAGSYSITVRYINPGTAVQQAAVAAAVARWESVVTGDLSDELIAGENAGFCGPGLQETVDDLLIFVDFAEIDGPGNVLGQAGACLLREAGHPVVGLLRLDGADLVEMEANGTLQNVILHEIGHVLGIGSVWQHGAFNLLTGAGTSDPYFTGANAVAAFDAVGGTTYAGNKVPVENTGGGGTRDVHWRESVLRSELMTGFISTGSSPLSQVSVASLQDMGYAVDLTQADAFSLSSALRAGPEEPTVRLVEGPLPFAPVILNPRRNRR